MPLTVDEVIANFLKIEELEGEVEVLGNRIATLLLTTDEAFGTLLGSRDISESEKDRLQIAGENFIALLIRRQINYQSKQQDLIREVKKQETVATIGGFPKLS